MNTIILAGKTYTAPAEWGEMTERHLLTWVKITSKNISVDFAFLLATILFYKIPKRMFFKLNAVQQYKLVETLIFLRSIDKMVNWIIPSVKIRFKTFLGPDSRLASSSIKEYSFSELYYGAYRKTQQEKYLDLLIATLYRPAGLNPAGNDYRIQLTDIRVRSGAKYLSRLGTPTKKAILMNYEGCRNYIIAKYPVIFKMTDPKKHNALPKIEDLIKPVAGGKFGNFKDTEETGLYLVLDHLSLFIEENEKSSTP